MRGIPALFQASTQSATDQASCWCLASILYSCSCGLPLQQESAMVYSGCSRHLVIPLLAGNWHEMCSDGLLCLQLWERVKGKRRSMPGCSLSPSNLSARAPPAATLTALCPVTPICSPALLLLTAPSRSVGCLHFCMIFPSAVCSGGMPTCANLRSAHELQSLSVAVQKG